MSKRLPLWEHQQQIHDFATAEGREYHYSSSKPGLGKTGAACRIIETQLNRDATRALVVCPLSLIYAAWAQDLRRFTPDLTFHVAEAPAARRDKAVTTPSDIVLINSDGIKWLAAKGKRYIQKHFGKHPILVIDESIAFKNLSSQRTKAALAISPLFKYRSLMSGTLFRRSTTEAFSQFKILDQGTTLGKNFYQFRSVMQTPIIKGGFAQWVDKPEALSVLHKRIAPHTIGFGYEKLANLPDMTHRVVQYELPQKHRDIYDEFRKKEILDIGDQRISSVHAGAKANKLLQIASGASYMDADGSGQQKWVIIDSGRYELIADLVNERDQVIVFYSWTHQKIELEKCFKKRQISHVIMGGSAAKRGQIQDQFNAGEFQCLLLHPQMGAFGLTLTAASTVIFASPIYDALLHEQGCARIRRGLQDKETTSITLVAPRTQDENAYKVFSGDSANMNIFDSLIHGY